MHVCIKFGSFSEKKDIVQKHALIILNFIDFVNFLNLISYNGFLIEIKSPFEAI